MLLISPVETSAAEMNVLTLSGQNYVYLPEKLSRACDDFVYTCIIIE